MVMQSSVCPSVRLFPLWRLHPEWYNMVVEQYVIRCGMAQIYAFWRFDTVTHLEGEIPLPKKTVSGACIYRGFQAKRDRQNTKISILSKLLRRFQPNFAQRYRGWLKHNESQMVVCISFFIICDFFAVFETSVVSSGFCKHQSSAAPCHKWHLCVSGHHGSYGTFGTRLETQMPNKIRK